MSVRLMSSLSRTSEIVEVFAESRLFRLSSELRTFEMQSREAGEYILSDKMHAVKVSKVSEWEKGT